MARFITVQARRWDRGDEYTSHAFNVEKIFFANKDKFYIEMEKRGYEILHTDFPAFFEALTAPKEEK